MKKIISLLSAIPLACCIITSASSQTTSTEDAVRANIEVPGNPFGGVMTADGTTAFVSMNGGAQTGVAVLKRTGQGLNLIHVIDLPKAAGLALASDMSVLIVTDDSGIALFDPAVVARGESQAPIQVDDTIGSKRAGAVEVTITRDNRYAFVSDEADTTVSVIRLERQADGRVHGTRIGGIPVGRLPVGLAVSPDDKLLYFTSEFAAASTTPSIFPNQDLVRNNCKGRPLPNGTLSVVDIARAETDPTHAVIVQEAAGCSPVRVVLTKDGRTAWVSARSENSVYAFDTQKLLSDPAHALDMTVSVGLLPVGLTLVANDSILMVANSDRTDPNKPTSTVNAIALSAHPRVYATIPVGSFPREFFTSPDGRLLYLTNFNSQQVTIFDVRQLQQLSSTQ